MDTNHIKSPSTGTEGYIEYTKANEKSKVSQLDVGNKKDNSGSYNPRTSKNSKNKTR